MRFNWASSLVLLLTTTEAANWFSKAVYNGWHETELERWLSDHDVPYPSPADRRDLEGLVKTNWDDKVQKPLGHISEQASDQWHHAKEWVFDSWSDSQIKAFLDRHGVPVPQPRKRDVLISTARENYEPIAKKLGEKASYPGNWLFATWSESELKEWLDERGWPVPQPSTRDKLIASVRRNARLASIQARTISASASVSADAAQATLSDALFSAWSDSDLKRFLDEHAIPVPQGSRRNEMIALARKNRASLLSQASTASASASRLVGAGTTKAGNDYAQATDDAQSKVQEAFDAAVQNWSNSRLKAYLDARGISVPQATKRDELLAKVRANKNKAASAWNAWTFETWDIEHLKQYLTSMNAKAAQRADSTRDDLMKQAQDAYSKASKAGGQNLASATSYMAQATQTAKDDTFDTWSHSELKAYLDSFGIPVYQGSNANELKATARRNSQYFKYGTTSSQGTLYAKLQDTYQWLLDQLKIGASSGRVQGQEVAEKAKDRSSEAVSGIRSEL
ncbi:double-strand break repair enhancer MSC1 [Aspergillus glaucus CBS 516.65]|uniref:Meiotic sister chromatid recombination protein Ish1/Msc1 n=1 Tax=Aspergillus glaucus CBS 516.65 TaxID=1160497 RepID=A0A1L9VP27_ASPGL|nr:hypothetical protein ASPGLDRAFT_169043 [Aspergillus glaucus CBS 516.65]OJJ85677.1 hypothetical protein ASPGLDRAFT_169043 [Aspergillus glaucus CBS 516.65]